MIFYLKYSLITNTLVRGAKKKEFWDFNYQSYTSYICYIMHRTCIWAASNEVAYKRIQFFRFSLSVAPIDLYASKKNWYS